MKQQIADCGLRSTGAIKSRHVIPLILCLLLSPSYRAAEATEIIDRVLAVVSGNLIMLSDVNAVRDFRLMDIAEGADPVRDILPRLIDRALILAEVERYAPPEPDLETVSRRLESVRMTFQSPQAFETALARVGFDEKHLRETLRQDLRILAYLDQRFTVPPLNEEDLSRYYREHPESFMQNGQLQPFEQARSRVVDAAAAERRRRLIEEWVAGLRRRAEIVEPTAVRPR
jgi:hypothetical protein